MARGVLEQLLRVLETLAHLLRGRSGQRTTDDRQIEAQRCELLPHGIMELARQRAPFSLLHREQAVGGRLQAARILVRCGFRLLTDRDIDSHPDETRQAPEVNAFAGEEVCLPGAVL